MGDFERLRMIDRHARIGPRRVRTKDESALWDAFTSEWIGLQSVVARVVVQRRTEVGDARPRERVSVRPATPLAAQRGSGLLRQQSKKKTLVTDALPSVSSSVYNFIAPVSKSRLFDGSQPIGTRKLSPLTCAP